MKDSLEWEVLLLNVLGFIVILLCCALLFTLGVIEKRRNQQYVQRLKVRVNVNGIRGKSTATRFITSILHEAGYAAIGKTTGTAARYIVPANGEETPIPRKPQGANIKEQVRMIKRAVEDGADAFVCECMAVKPEYQDVYQNQMFFANVTVIVNVVEDHLDVMGPTLDEIARAFSRTIPYGGILITVPSPYADFFKGVAEVRNTKVFLADNEQIPKGYLDRFDYIVFPDNVGLGLAFAESMGISKETALEGMLKATPDPGALRINHLDKTLWHDSVFVNGFAANEPGSSLKIWELIQGVPGLPLENPIILFNGRPDRVDRTRQFVDDFFPKMEGVTLVGMGQMIKPIQQAKDEGRFPGVLEYHNWEDVPAKEVVARLREMMHGRLLYGVGNIHGDGGPLLEGLAERSDDGHAMDVDHAMDDEAL